jgi:hypothetical protein
MKHVEKYISDILTNKWQSNYPRNPTKCWFNYPINPTNAILSRSEIPPSTHIFFLLWDYSFACFWQVLFTIIWWLSSTSRHTLVRFGLHLHRHTSSCWPCWWISSPPSPWSLKTGMWRLCLCFRPSTLRLSPSEMRCKLNLNSKQLNKMS